MTAAVFHRSIAVSLEGLDAQTPLALLGLVPFLSIAAAIPRWRPAPEEPEIHDRQIDWIIGLPLLVAAAAVLLVLPSRMSATFWEWRLDLAALSLWVAGTVTVVFGCRTLWRLRWPIGFLVLAWPLPWILLLGPLLAATTAGCVATVGVLAQALRVAVPAGGEGAFMVGHGAQAFPVVVASACSGITSTVGFAIFGMAYVTWQKGSRWARALWLITGLAVTFTLNVVRLLMILAAGSRWGEHAAFRGLHEVFGWVTIFCAAVVMGLSAPLFGLKDPEPRKVQAAAAKLKVAVPRALFALVAIAALAVPLTIADGNLAAFSVLADAWGAPRLTAFTTSQPPRTPLGPGSVISVYTQQQALFGQSSTWYRYHWGTGPSQVYADVITAEDGQVFEEYSETACYLFHGYDLSDQHRVQVGAGVTATLLSFTDSDGEWLTESWVWPVNSTGQTRWERVTLLTPPRPGATQRLASTASALLTDARLAPIGNDHSRV